MPDGRVQRIDADRELVYVVHRGRTYAAPVSEVEPAARIPSVRVHFDLVRTQGSERAANVRLRTGTRTSKRQRRFGDLVGARRPGAKVATIADRSMGVDVTTQPFRVARAWLAAMADQDPDGATSLYRSGAGLHTEQGTRRGRREIRVELELGPGPGIDVDGASVSGFDRYVRIDFRDDAGEHTTYLEIEGGSITEQWLDTAPDVAPPEAAPIEEVNLVRRGEIPDAAGDYARSKVVHLVEHSGRPLRFARVKLTRSENPANERPAMVEITLEFDDGTLLRAHRAATTFTEATDLAVGRLGAGIEHLRDRHRHDPTGMPPTPGEWRHGNLASEPHPYFDRPPGEREVVRHKSFAPGELTIEEAVWDLGMLDYDFFLFVDLDTGGDVMLERADDGDYLLHRLEPVAADEASDATATGGETVALSNTPPPELAVSDAVNLLTNSGELRLFFRNRTSGRGNVVYRRYDGHYGLITPPLGSEVEPASADRGG